MLGWYFFPWVVLQHGGVWEEASFSFSICLLRGLGTLFAQMMTRESFAANPPKMLMGCALSCANMQRNVERGKKEKTATMSQLVNLRYFTFTLFYQFAPACDLVQHSIAYMSLFPASHWYRQIRKFMCSAASAALFPLEKLAPFSPRSVAPSGGGGGGGKCHPPR